jgi:ABC-type nickel/cobalt efflux system permease component RcnA
MTAALIVILLGVWVIYSGWRFYRQVNWEEEPVSTPDLGALHKRQVELTHIQEVLEEAHAKGQLSRAFMEEFNRFYDGEIREIRSVTPPKR